MQRPLVCRLLIVGFLLQLSPVVIAFVDRFPSTRHTWRFNNNRVHSSCSAAAAAAGESPDQEESTATTCIMSTMEEIYDQLAMQAMIAFHKTERRDARLWIGVVGAPGSGKTTVAQNVVDRINQRGSLKAIVVPMDGYHLTQKEMHENGYSMKRRGAPWTFNATKMYQQLQGARQKDAQTNEVWLPDYSRDISDPVPDRIKIDASVDIVIIEGLYLTLGALVEEMNQPGSSTYEVAQELEQEIAIRDELRKWQPLLSLWDQTIFVEPPGGFAENKRRLVERSLRTWTPAKTELWYPGATDREAATKRVELNDERNAMLIDCCKSFATFIVKTK